MARALDLSRLDAATGGDAQLNRDLLTLFLTHAPGWAAAIAAARDGPALRLAAHALKGAARTVGAGAVEQAAEAAEFSAERFTPESRDAHAASVAAALGPALEAVRWALGR